MRGFRHCQAGDQHDAAKVLKGFGECWCSWDIIHARLKVAQAFAKELRDEKTDH